MTCPPNKETLRPNGTKSNKAQIRRQHIFRFGGKINNARINFVLSAGMLAIEVLKLKHQTHIYQQNISFGRCFMSPQKRARKDPKEIE